MEFLILIPILALGVWMSPWTYNAAFARAESRDMAYYAAHPDCTWDEAHRHRERVRRFFLRP